MAFIIGIAAPPGGGKTILSKALAESLGDATTIHFDAYEQVTSSPMEDIREWMRRGADPNEFDIPSLNADLERSRRGEPVTNPIEDGEILPPKYVLFETPFGREHLASGRFIDRLIWIDVPLDLALARKLLNISDYDKVLGNGSASIDGLSWLRGYLDNYVNGTRSMLLIQRERIARTADLILDGKEDLSTMVKRVTQDIFNHISPEHSP